MQNCGLRITIEVFKNTDKRVTEVIFDQRDLPPEQLLELQKGAVSPLKEAVGRITDGWIDQAIALQGKDPT
jgi:hypothetical protein